MASPGFSLTELIQAIAKCKSIYDAFTDEYESAPAKIRDLVDTCKYLRDILKDFQSTVGDGYSQEHSFGRKLDECNVFINKYKSLKQEYLVSAGETTITARLRTNWERAWQTGKYAFDGERARDLKDALSLEIQKLVLFILVFALKRTVPVNPSASVTHLVHREHMHGQTDFEGLFARFQSVRYLYEREMYMAVQQNRPPNLNALHAELKSGWHALCVRAGLAQEQGEAPPLQTERLLEAPSRNMNDLVITLGLPSIHTTLQPWASGQLPIEPAPSDASLTSHTLSPSSIFRGTDPPSSFANTTPLDPERPRPAQKPPSLRLPDPELPYHIAIITIPILRINTPIRLRHWECHNDGDAHKVAWRSENPPGTLEHYIPSGVFPETLNSEHGNSLHVKFSEAHELIWRGEDGVPHNHDLLAEYIFVSPTDRKVFQGDIRGKVLVDTWDFGVLWSNRISRQNSGEAILQDLKIWQDRQSPYHHTLSFFASTREMRHLEFPLLFFQCDVQRDPNQPKFARINFSRRRDSSSNPQKARRRSTLSRASSALFQSKSPQKADGTSSQKKRASVSSDTSDHLRHDDIPHDLGFLAIRFNTKEGANNFGVVFTNGHVSDSNPTTFPEESYQIGQSSRTLSEISPVISPTQLDSHPP